MAHRNLRELMGRLYGSECFYCLCTFTESGSRSRTIDHLVPSSRGGPTVLWNLVLACDGCNNAKADLIWYEYHQTDSYKKRREAVVRERSTKKPRVLTDLRSG